MSIFQFNIDSSLKNFSKNLLGKIQKGSLYVCFPDGEKIIFEGEKLGNNAEIKLNNYKVFTKLLRKGSIGFAESYMDGDFTSSNLTNSLLLKSKVAFPRTLVLIS